MAKKKSRGGITDDRGRSPRHVGGHSNMARKSNGKSGACGSKPKKTKNY